MDKIDHSFIYSPTTTYHRRPLFLQISLLAATDPSAEHAMSMSAMGTSSGSVEAALGGEGREKKEKEEG